MKYLQLTDHEILFSSRLRCKSHAYHGNITSLDNLLKSQNIQPGNTTAILSCSLSQ